MKNSLLFILSLFSLNFYAQNPKYIPVYREIDSLILISNSTSNDTNKVKLLNTISVKYIFVNDYEKAKIYTDSTLILIDELKQNGQVDLVLSKKSESLAHTNNGQIYYHDGDYPKAIASHFLALQLRKELGDQSNEASTLISIGNIYRNLGNFTEALSYFKSALQLREALGDKKGIAVALNNIGAVLSVQGNYFEAMNAFMSMFKIFTEMNDKAGLASAYNSIGIIYFYHSNYDEALENYFISLKLREEIGEKRALAICYNNIGTAYFRKGKFVEGVKYSNASLEIFEAMADKFSIAQCYYNMAGIYYSQSQDLEKKSPLRDSLYQTAMNYYDKALKLKEGLNDKIGMSNCFGSLARVILDQKDPDKMELAISYAHKSYEIAAEISARDQINVALHNLICAYLRVGQIDSARYYLSALKKSNIDEFKLNYFNLSEREREFYFTEIEHDIALYYDFTLAHHDKFQNMTDTAYNFALTNKGLSLKSSTAMRQAILSGNDTLLIQEYEDWLSLKKTIASLYASGKDIKNLELEALEKEKELVKKSDLFSDFEKVQNIDWKKVRDGLDDNQAAIEFVHFRSDIDTINKVIYIALLIKKDSEHPEIIKLCGEQELVEILGKLQGNNLNFVNEIYGTKSKANKELYKKIWQPLEPFLTDVNEIFYSPSGLLHKVSFAALNKENDVFLCDNFKLHQQSSTGKVAYNTELTFNDADKFLMLGGVEYNSEQSTKEVWKYLPGTLEETNNIYQFLQKKKMDVTMLQAENATEENFKKSVTESTVLHLSTHGFFFPDPEQLKEELKKDEIKEQNLIFRGDVLGDSKDETGGVSKSATNYARWSFVDNKNPLMRSGVVLAGANDVWDRNSTLEGEDGILTAAEVALLDMRNTKLVVLSACETGLGDIMGSEGVYGLQRAFKMAGVNYIIMSLWQVPDKETAEFMTLFYKRLIKLKDIHLAFNQTQKAMRAKYDPYYWAAFVLIE